MIRRLCIPLALACAMAPLASAQMMAVSIVNETPYSLRLDLGFGCGNSSENWSTTTSSDSAAISTIPVSARIAADVLPSLTLETSVELQAVVWMANTATKYAVGPFFEPRVFFSFINNTKSEKASIVLSRTNIGGNMQRVDYVELPLAIQRRLGLTASTRFGFSGPTGDAYTLLNSCNVGIRYQQIRDAEVLVGFQEMTRRDRLILELRYWPNLGMIQAPRNLTLSEAARIGACIEYHSNLMTIGLVGSIMPLSRDYSISDTGLYFSFPLGWRVF